MPDFGAYSAPDKISHPEYYWKAKGQKQGDFKNTNPSNNKEYNKYSRVFAIQWGVDQPSDAHSGQVTGRNIMEPIQITKYVDQCSPQIMQAMIHHEVIQESEFVYVDYPQAQGGKAAGAQAAAQMTRIFTVKGTQGFILKIEAGSTPEGRLLERISFMFNQITWKSDVGTTEADWQRSDTH